MVALFASKQQISGKCGLWHSHKNSDHLKQMYRFASINPDSYITAETTPLDIGHAACLVRPVKFLKSCNYILARTCKALAFQLVIKSYELSGILDDMQRKTLVIRA